MKEMFAETDIRDDDEIKSNFSGTSGNSFANTPI